VVDAEEYAWMAAGICAGISLLTQAAASMWPAAIRVPPAMAGPAWRGPGVAGGPQASEPVGPVGEAPAAEAISSSAAPVPPVVIAGAQPSFAGQAASAGLSVLGKLLLLAGLLAAASHVWLLSAEQSLGRDGQAARSGGTVKDDGTWPGLVVAPLATGSLLLVMARRRDGAGHIVRGCLGCLLMMGAGLTAIRWAELPLTAVWAHKSLEVLRPPAMWGPLALIGLLLGAGLLLLVWPRRRTNRPIVV